MLCLMLDVWFLMLDTLMLDVWCLMPDAWCLMLAMNYQKIEVFALWTLESQSDSCHTEFHLVLIFSVTYHIKNSCCLEEHGNNFLTLAWQYLLFSNWKMKGAPNMFREDSSQPLCCSLLSTFLSHIRHFTTPNGIKKKKLLLMQSYVAMLFYLFIKSKQHSCNNREKKVKSSINVVFEVWIRDFILFSSE